MWQRGGESRAVRRERFGGVAPGETGSIRPEVPGVPESAVDRSYEHCRIYVKREAG
ncbi:MAG: hypothetical protein R3B49_10220 [Phycisphaerales bacterium]